MYNRNTFKEFISNTDKKIFVKLTASWCGPCQTVKPHIEKWFNDLTTDINIICIEIDIDESVDLYAMLKTKRLVSGIPTILYYNEENCSYIPDDSISGTNTTDIDRFFLSSIES
tara:strand:+ start:109 stop:450 length:342 start_codon:yes stop_codon:yes gene_type:complete